ncbi:MAG: histidine phosphotransferase [Hyphomicrobiales bacterium]|nr:histidine phosphotransferase [Hyphomicrobiales bacterium]
MTIASLSRLDLAALLCSRVCHDVISPVGAIVNGLEVLEAEDDEEMRKIAMDLIKKSALAASARLQFCRLAFGASGSRGAAIDTSDAENVARGLLDNDRTSLKWSGEPRLAPKNVVKLVLNLCLVAASAVPRGGTIMVDLGAESERTAIQVEARGAAPRLPHGAADLFSGRAVETIDGHSIQPYYTTLLAAECGMMLEALLAPESVTLVARRMTAADPASEHDPAAVES